MNPSQRIVAIGALSGIISMIVLAYLLYTVLPNPENIHTNIDALVFTLRIHVFTILPLFLGIVMVGNARFLSDAINPLLGAESETMKINGRFVDNTLQEFALFFVGTLALSTLVLPENIRIITAVSIVFIIARIAFWIGYRINPLYRAPGMAGTSYLCLGILAYDIWKILM